MSTEVDTKKLLDNPRAPCAYTYLPATKNSCTALYHFPAPQTELENYLRNKKIKQRQFSWSCVIIKVDYSYIRRATDMHLSHV
jgi:hypothetical protein